ncbi:AP-1 complex subunit sigma-1 isoform X2 [Selaginella moellendorffii]|uniref:AP-1 complex subunit sigma-1 isoform X2 n=1 Tax=Selaginella moellendorffii TaxID=88036 RepID=UPI000D1CB8CD|nr:AP-1 complex subunit sigma-1 isoform X2 [Selaginella moellendorffii]|eukprot:XP_024533933.1 AP-1 complex subunit sigma-1 isoform X2 [Selaginella moellendorffii]
MKSATFFSSLFSLFFANKHSSHTGRFKFEISSDAKSPKKGFGRLREWFDRSTYRFDRDAFVLLQIQAVFLVSRQGKVRLQKWYTAYPGKDRPKAIREITSIILSRGTRLCNFIEWKDLKVIYKRYASLYFCMCVDADDNELDCLEVIHLFVEVLDRYFGNVCELDLVFNFHKAYYILDEVLLSGELQESSKKSVARVISAQDTMVEKAKETGISHMMSSSSK